MSFFVPEGSKFQYSATFASALTVTAASNANPALLTSAAHGLVDGDVVLFNSGWEDANNTLYVVDQQDANTFLLTGLDTSDTTHFAPGSGTGTVQKVTGWTDIPQVIGITPNGGNARFTPVQLLASRNAIQIPTGFDPSSQALVLAHDPANATWKAMIALSRNTTKVGFRVVGQATVYSYGYMICSENPKMQAGQVNQVDVSVSNLGRFISY